MEKRLNIILFFLASSIPVFLAGCVSTSDSPEIEIYSNGETIEVGEIGDFVMWVHGSNNVITVTEGELTHLRVSGNGNLIHYNQEVKIGYIFLDESSANNLIEFPASSNPEMSDQGQDNSFIEY